MRGLSNCGQLRRLLPPNPAQKVTSSRRCTVWRMVQWEVRGPTQRNLRNSETSVQQQQSYMGRLLPPLCRCTLSQTHLHYLCQGYLCEWITIPSCTAREALWLQGGSTEAASRSPGHRRHPEPTRGQVRHPREMGRRKGTRSQHHQGMSTTRT